MNVNKYGPWSAIVCIFKSYCVGNLLLIVYNQCNGDYVDNSWYSQPF